jgi:hypothetical protein
MAPAAIIDYQDTAKLNHKINLIDDHHGGNEPMQRALPQRA